MSESVVFENARILDGSSPEGEHDRFIHVVGNIIAEVSNGPIRDTQARRIDLRGKTLMPGLIDCHVHVIAAMLDLGRNAALPDALVAYHAARIMMDMLHRGFTTVRDLGGATYTLVEALEQGLIVGPRLVVCGKALSQTGGHSDFRGRYDTRGRLSDATARRDGPHLRRGRRMPAGGSRRASTGRRPRFMKK